MYLIVATLGYLFCVPLPNIMAHWSLVCVWWFVIAALPILTDEVQTQATKLQLLVTLGNVS